MREENGSIAFTLPEQAVANMPERMPLAEALGVAHRILVQSEAYADLAAAMHDNAASANEARTVGLMRKAHVLHRIGVQLADIGAPTLGDRVEEFLKAQDF